MFGIPTWTSVSHDGSHRCLMAQLQWLRPRWSSCWYAVPLLLRMRRRLRSFCLPRISLSIWWLMTWYGRSPPPIPLSASRAMHSLQVLAQVTGKSVTIIMEPHKEVSVVFFWCNNKKCGRTFFADPVLPCQHFPWPQYLKWYIYLQLKFYLNYLKIILHFYMYLYIFFAKITTIHNWFFLLLFNSN